MADCGICLDVLRNPVSVPCGHVHCERCLRSHIGSGTDALKSTCPTCRKPFHIATPDFTFVPQKYHDFILPSVRKVYMDVPSITAMEADIGNLTQRLEAFAKEKEHLRQRCTDYKFRLESMIAEKNAIIESEEEARQEVINLREKYDSLKKKFKEAQSRDDTRNMTPSQSISRRSSQNLEGYHEIFPKVEENPVSLSDLNPHPSRPKRSLPRSRLSRIMYYSDASTQSVKRQRIQRHSDVGTSSRMLEVVIKPEDQDEK